MLLAGMVLSGTVLSGTVLFGQTYPDRTANNENIDISAGGTFPGTIYPVDRYYGLIGANGSTTVTPSGNIAATEGSYLVVGKLDTGKINSEVVTDAVTMTINSSSQLQIGNSSDTYTSTLAVIGTDTTASVLKVETEDGLALLQNGAFQVGSSSGSGLGQAELNQLIANSGSYIFVTATGELLVTGGGQGINSNSESFKNYGKVTVNNGTGSGDYAYFANYTDDSNAELIVDNKVIIESTTTTISGKLQANEFQSYAGSASSASVTLGSTSAVDITKSLTIGAFETSSGAGDGKDGTLTINGSNTLTDSNVNVGGIQVIGSASGGTLSLGSYAFTRINGLDAKYNENGLTASDGLYDIWLDGAFTISANADLVFTSLEEDVITTSGLRFGGTKSSTSSLAGGIYADNFYLSGSGIAPETEGDTVTELSISGTLGINETLYINNRSVDDTTVYDLDIVNTGLGNSHINELVFETDHINFNNGDGTTASVLFSVGTFNMTQGTFVTTANATSVFENLTLNSADSATVLMTIKAGSTSGSTTTSNGILKADLVNIDKGTINAAGTMTRYSTQSNAVWNLNNEGIINLTGASIMSNMELNINEGGKITDTAGTNTITFRDATINNNSTLTGTDSAITVNTLALAGTSVWNNGGYIGANLMQLSDTSSIYSKSGETLTLKENATFTVNSGASLNIDFDKDNNNSTVLDFTNNNGTVNLASGSKITAANVDDLEVGTYTRTIVDNNETANTFKSTYDSNLFYTMEGNVLTSNTGLEVILNVLHTNYADFALTANEKSVANYIDNSVNKDTASESIMSVVNNMKNYSSEAEIRNAFNAMSGVQRANSLMLAMDSPWQAAYDQMRYTRHKELSANFGSNGSSYYNSYRGQAPVVAGNNEYYYNDDMSGYDMAGSSYNGRTMGSLLLGPKDLTRHSAWGNVFHTSFDANSDGNSAYYGISQTGTRLGYDWVNSGNTIAGITFSYSQPSLYSDDQKINMDNYHLGLYWGNQNLYGTGIDLYVGYGTQQYTSKRIISFTDFNDYYETAWEGDSLAANVRLYREYQMDMFTLIRPLIQFDMQQVWQDGYTEGNGTFALNCNKTSWNRSFVRAGFEGEFNAEFFQFTSRAIYGYQVSGDTAPEMEASFAGVAGSNSFLIQGVDQGSSFGDVGVGALGYFDCAKRWIITGNYDFTFSENTKAHTGVVSMMYHF